MSRNEKAKEKYIGLEIETKSGKCKVIDYVSRDEVYFQFNDGTVLKGQTSQTCSGKIKNPNAPLVQGVGFIGVGKYSSREHPEAHKKWTAMFERCYCEKYQSTKPSYIGCTVSPEWFSFQKFAEWFYSKKFEKGWHLDKDLLFSANKIYCAERCDLVPSEVNALTNLGTKPSRIKMIADKYRDEISESMYNALIERSKSE